MRKLDDITDEELSSLFSEDKILRIAVHPGYSVYYSNKEWGPLFFDDDPIMSVSQCLLSEAKKSEKLAQQARNVDELRNHRVNAIIYFQLSYELISQTLHLLNVREEELPCLLIQPPDAPDCARDPDAYELYLERIAGDQENFLYIESNTMFNGWLHDAPEKGKKPERSRLYDEERILQLERLFSNPRFEDIYILGGDIQKCMKEAQIGIELVANLPTTPRLLIDASMTAKSRFEDTFYYPGNFTQLGEKEFIELARLVSQLLETNLDFSQVVSSQGLQATVDSYGGLPFLPLLRRIKELYCYENPDIVYAKN